MNSINNVNGYNLGMIKGWIIALFKDDDKVKLINELGLGEFISGINNSKSNNVHAQSNYFEDVK